MAKSSGPMRLELQALRNGYPCLPPESGIRLARAAAICLEERKHRQRVEMAVLGGYQALFQLAWPRTNDRVRREWSDAEEATENGAVGIAILLVDRLTNYHVVLRSWKKTGFDYWLGLKGAKVFQGCARLEASGMRQGAKNAVNRRVEQKKNQTKQSDDLKLPAFIVVVEFGSPTAVVVKR